MPSPEELAKLQQQGALSPETAKAVAHRLATQGGKVDPVTAYVAGWKPATGLGQPVAPAAKPKPAPQPAQGPKSAPADPDAELWKMLDNRIAWSKAIAATNHDAGVYGAEALRPEIADRYRGILKGEGQGANLVGVSIANLSPKERDLMARALNEDYFRKLLAAQAQAQADAQQAARPQDRFDLIAQQVAARRRGGT